MTTTANWKSNPATLSTRTWSDYSKIILRTYNEPKHAFMDRSVHCVVVVYWHRITVIGFLMPYHNIDCARGIH